MIKAYGVEAHSMILWHFIEISGSCTISLFKRGVIKVHLATPFQTGPRIAA